MPHKPAKKKEKKTAIGQGIIKGERRNPTTGGAAGPKREGKKFFGRSGETTKEGLAQEKKEFGTVTGAAKDKAAFEKAPEAEVPQIIPRVEDSERKELITVTQTIDGQEFTQQVTPEAAAVIERGNTEALEESARAEGRVPFNELPIYQQILAGTAVSGVSAKGLVRTGRLGQVGKKGLKPVIKSSADRFASNGKAAAETTKLLTKSVGLSLPTAGLALSTIGTYPFAGFIKEEALQTLSFATKSARDSGDLETEERALRETFELLNGEQSILDKIPYANVVRQLRNFFDAARTKLTADAKSFEKRKNALTEEPEVI